MRSSPVASAGVAWLTWIQVSEDVTARTGLPQSYVSESVARLRDQGIVETSADPADGRRTLVRVTAEHPRTVAAKGAVPVDAALAAGGDVRLARSLWLELSPRATWAQMISPAASFGGTYFTFGVEVGIRLDLAH